MPSLYFWISFCLSSFSSTQYSLGMTKLDVIRHSGQDLQRRKSMVISESWAQTVNSIHFDTLSQFYLIGNLWEENKQEGRFRNRFGVTSCKFEIWILKSVNIQKIVTEKQWLLKRQDYNDRNENWHSELKCALFTTSVGTRAQSQF